MGSWSRRKSRAAQKLHTDYLPLVTGFEKITQVGQAIVLAQLRALPAPGRIPAPALLHHFEEVASRRSPAWPALGMAPARSQVLPVQEAALRWLAPYVLGIAPAKSRGLALAPGVRSLARQAPPPRSNSLRNLVLIRLRTGQARVTNVFSRSYRQLTRNSPSNKLPTRGAADEAA